MYLSCPFSERRIAVSSRATLLSSRPGDGVAEVDGDASCEAGRHQEDAPFAAGAGKVPAGQCGGCGVPVDGGHRDGAVAGAGAGRDEKAVLQTRWK